MYISNIVDKGNCKDAMYPQTNTTKILPAIDWTQKVQAIIKITGGNPLHTLHAKPSPTRPAASPITLAPTYRLY